MVRLVWKLACLLVLLALLPGCRSAGTAEGLLDRVTIPDVVQGNDPEQVSQEIYGPFTVGQAFESHFSGLRHIDVFVYAEKERRPQTVIFHLRDNPAAELDLVTIRVDGSDLPAKGFHPFTFEPIPSSVNKSYYFYLEAPDASQEDGIKLGYTTNDYFRGYVNFFGGDILGSRYENHQPTDGYLAFRTYNLIREDLQRVVRDATARFAEDVPFFGVYSLVLVVIVVLLVGTFLGRFD